MDIQEGTIVKVTGVGYNRSDNLATAIKTANFTNTEAEWTQHGYVKAFTGTVIKESNGLFLVLREGGYAGWFAVGCLQRIAL